MAYYQYQARDRLGELHDGMVESKNLRSAVQELQQQGYTVLQVRQTRACPCGSSILRHGEACPECGRVANHAGSALAKAGILALFAAVLAKALHLF